MRIACLIALTVASAIGADAAFAAGTITTRRVTSQSELKYDPGTAIEWVNPLPPPDASDTRGEQAPSGLPSGSVAGTGQSVGSSGQRGSFETRAFGSFGIPYTTSRVQIGATSLPTDVGSVLSQHDVSLSCDRQADLHDRQLVSVVLGVAHPRQRHRHRGALHPKFRIGQQPLQQLEVPPRALGQVSRDRRADQTVRLLQLGDRDAAGTSWANGTDTGSGAARNNDLALIILAKNSGGQFVGQITGYLGYGYNNYSFISSPKTGDLSVAATTTLGYPALMDNGDIMQRTDGPSYLTTVSGALQISQGTNFTAGSSGGPWIVNFWTKKAKLSGGAVSGDQSDMDVIGVTSWGTVDPNAPKDNFSSRFGQNTRVPEFRLWRMGSRQYRRAAQRRLLDPCLTAGRTDLRAGRLLQLTERTGQTPFGSPVSN